MIPTYNLLRTVITFLFFIAISANTIGQTCTSTLIGTDRSDGGNTLVEFDPATGTSIDLFELNPTSNSAYGIVVSDQYCYIHREFSPTESFLYCVDITTGVYNPNFPVQVSENSLFQGNSCDMTLFGLERENNGVVELASIDLETGSFTIISPEPVLFDLIIPLADGSQIASSALVGNIFCFPAENDSGQNTAEEFDPIHTCIDITTGELFNNFNVPGPGRGGIFDNFVLDEDSGLLYGLIRGFGRALFFASFDPATGSFTIINDELPATEGSSPAISGSNYCYIAETQISDDQIESQFTCLDLATGNVVIEFPDVGSLELSGFDTNCTCVTPTINPIPTASEWGLIILALLLLCFSVVAIRNREKRRIESSSYTS